MKADLSNTLYTRMATVGSIATHSPEDSWSQYIEQLKLYLEANDRCDVRREEECHIFLL